MFEKVFGKKNKKILEKILNFFFQHQVTIPSAHPVQITSRSDYSMTVIMWYHTKRGLATTVQPPPDFLGHAVIARC